MQRSIKNIAFAGSGNVAWHLATGLKLQGFNISRIWSRDPSNAADLAGICGADVSDELSGLRKGIDLLYNFRRKYMKPTVSKGCCCMLLLYLQGTIQTLCILLQMNYFKNQTYLWMFFILSCWKQL